ncbi:MAG: C40 family peptidase [Bacteroidota bacterium]
MRKTIIKILLVAAFGILTFFGLPASGNRFGIKEDPSGSHNFKVSDKVKDSLEKVTLVDSIVSYAQRYLGKPYHYGGSSERGFDCAGFVSFVYRKFGFTLPRSAPAQAHVGKKIAMDQIQPGDLMFFKGSSGGGVGHVSLVIKNDKDGIVMIHASTWRHKVLIDKYDNIDYYKKRFVMAKRLIL